jgi:hypothetical protein
MRENGWGFGVLVTIFLAGSSSHAEKITFTPKELFRVPFGAGREALRARQEEGNFIFPRDFTMDAAGHFYVNDTNNHRIARFSMEGKYEMGFQYPMTAVQIFSHADSRENLWLLISDPIQGTYYGVYDSRGKSLRSGVFKRFDHYRLHLGDDGTLHVILSSDKNPELTQTYILDEEHLIMKKEAIARPPESHHQVRKNDHVYFVDQVPDGTREDARHVNRVTDESHRNVGDIQGTVIYITGRGEVYTRLGEREIRVYDVNGSLKGKVFLKGLGSSCASIRFDTLGNLYQLDGIPNSVDQYTSDMPGMRLMQWARD